MQIEGRVQSETSERAQSKDIVPLTRTSRLDQSKRGDRWGEHDLQTGPFQERRQVRGAKEEENREGQERAKNQISGWRTKKAYGPMAGLYGNQTLAKGSSLPHWQGHLGSQ